MGRVSGTSQRARLDVVTMLVAATTVAFLTQVDGPVSAIIFAVLFGVNARGATVLGQILIARYYGRRAFGAISSVLDPFHKGGLGVGALLAGAAFDYFGNYRLIFFCFMGSYLCSALLVFLARRPPRNAT